MDKLVVGGGLSAAGSNHVDQFKGDRGRQSNPQSAASGPAAAGPRKIAPNASRAGISFFRNNALDANGNHRTPNVGTGYRFEDFAKNGRFYDWDMNGQAKEDTVDATRRTAGAEKDASGWLTTDVPLEEANAIVDGDTFAAGNAHVDG